MSEVGIVDIQLAEVFDSIIILTGIIVGFIAASLIARKALKNEDR